MKRLAVAVLVVLSFVIPAAALAQGHDTAPGWLKHHQPVAPGAPSTSLTYDGTNVTFTAEGAAPGVRYWLSYAYMDTATGSGCNTGVEGPVAGSDGVLFDQEYLGDLTCGQDPADPATLTVWAHTSIDFGSPPATLADGTAATVTVSLNG